jgi:hypothetical protein
MLQHKLAFASPSPVEVSMKLGTAPVSQLIFHQDNIEAGAAEDRFF